MINVSVEKVLWNSFSIGEAAEPSLGNGSYATLAKGFLQGVVL